MPYILGMATASPVERRVQDEILAQYLATVGPSPSREATARRIFQTVQVKRRALAAPLAQYPQIRSFSQRNALWLDAASDLVEQAVTNLLHRLDLSPEVIGLIASSTVTGVAIPSLEARLMNRLPFSPKTKRMPFFGLGCVAGVAGINRVADYLVGAPDEAALFVTAELCSLCWEKRDSIASIVSAALFGDGCAAVILVGDQHPLARQAPLEICATDNHFFPNTERVMGFDVGDHGFEVVLNAEVPEIIRSTLRGHYDDFLERGHTAQIDFFACHPGGPKVLKAIERSLHLERGELWASWQCLHEHGNMSSASVLYILEDVLANLEQRSNGEERTAPSPSKQDMMGLMTAMGPAFCLEMTLLKYRPSPTEANRTV